MHDENLEGEITKGCRLALMTGRQHSPLHNNERELIGYFASPLGSREPIGPVRVLVRRIRISSSHILKQIPVALN